MGWSRLHCLLRNWVGGAVLCLFGSLDLFEALCILLEDSLTLL